MMSIEAVIEERTILEPGRYTIIDGKLFKVKDDTPPGAEQDGEPEPGPVGPGPFDGPGFAC